MQLLCKGTMCLHNPDKARNYMHSVLREYSKLFFQMLEKNNDDDDHF